MFRQLEVPARMTRDRSELFTDVAKSLAFALICYLTARAGLTFALDATKISLIWPLTGISMAVLMLFGRRYWPGLWLGQFLNELSLGFPPLLAVTVACGSAAMAVFGAYWLQERLHLNPSFGRVRDVLNFFSTGVLFSPLISALIGASSFYLAGVIPPGNYPIALFNWWVGDAMGVLIVAPFLLIWGRLSLPTYTRRQMAEALSLVALLVIFGWVIFNQGFMPRSFYPLSYLIFPLMVWGALRFGQRMVVSLMLVVSLIVAVTTAQQLDTMRSGMIWNMVLFLWAFLATMAITSMLLAAIFAERRTMEKAARSLDERFSKAFHAAPVPIWITNVDEGRLIDVNEAFCAMFGYSREEALGRTSRELKLWENADLRPKLLELFRQEGRLTRIEVNLRPKNGLLRSGLLSSESIELDGEPRLLNMFYDITERVRSEEALQDSEGRYRELFEGVDDAIFVHDMEANILDVNEAACRRLGYSREELLRMKVTDIDTPGFATGFAARLQQQLEQGYLRQIEGMQHTKDGREIYIDVNTKLITYQGRPAVLAVDRDITERKLAEQKLLESEARYRAVVEDQTEFIARVAPDWQLKFCNEAYQRYYGKSAEELNGSYFKPQVHEDDYELVRSSLKSLSPQHPLVNYEHRVRLPDGAVRWQQWTVRAITKDGAISEYQFVGKDITEVKEMEKQRLAAALEHGKMKILTDFIAAASHDFRAPLSVINTSAYLLRRASEEEQRERHFKQITEQTYHIDRLVDGLLTMSKLDRGDVFHFRLIYPNSVIRQIEARKQAQINGKQQVLQLDLDPAVPAIEADESGLYRGIVQFVDNAIHYTPVGGTITIQTRVGEDCVSVAVIDTGVGISSEDMPHIFERLYRGEGHRPVGGQGLGLPIAAKIIEGHRGRIEVESQPGSGSTFRVFLPLRQSETNAAPSLPQ